MRSAPSKSIPIAIFVSMSIVTGSYILMSSALTLMVDYKTVNPSSAFSDAFEQVSTLTVYNNHPLPNYVVS